MEVKFKKESFYEARLYIGSRRGYNGPVFSQWELNQAVGDFQVLLGDKASAVRVTPTTFQFGTYVEAGWEIAAIQYPRFPKDEVVIKNFMVQLAKHLMEKFDQNRISVSDPEEVVLLEREDAESGPNPGKIS